MVKFDPSRIPLPKTESVKEPSSSRSTRQPLITADEVAVDPLPESELELAPLHLRVTSTPCSLPSGQPVGALAGNAVRFLLVPFGPLTNGKNVFPADPGPSRKNASIRFEVRITNLFA